MQRFLSNFLCISILYYAFPIMSMYIFGFS
nr:MAG TPA: hypothetical protein [Caudoviricetes sp.]